MKKLLAVALILILSFAVLLSGCIGGTEYINDAENETEAEAEKYVTEADILRFANGQNEIFSDSNSNRLSITVEARELSVAYIHRGVTITSETAQAYLDADESENIRLLYGIRRELPGVVSLIVEYQDENGEILAYRVFR